MFNILHEKLYSIIKWYIGCQHDFKVNTGNMGRYFKHYLTLEEQTKLKKTYLYSTPKNKLESLFTMFDMMEDMGKYIAEYLSYSFPFHLAINMRNYCLKTKELILNK